MVFASGLPGVTLDLNGFQIRAQRREPAGPGSSMDESATSLHDQEWNDSLGFGINGVASVGPPPAKGGTCLQLAISGCAGGPGGSLGG